MKFDSSWIWRIKHYSAFKKRLLYRIYLEDICSVEFLSERYGKSIQSMKTTLGNMKKEGVIDYEKRHRKIVINKNHPLFTRDLAI